MSLLFALAAFAQPVVPADCGFLRFSRAASNRAPAPLREQVCVTRDRGARGEYLFRRTAAVRGSTIVTWAATRRCPAAKAQLAALEDVQLPAPDVPGIGEDNQTITLDGVSYRLEVPANFGGGSGYVTLQSNVNTPLARWVEETSAILESCWRDRQDAN